MLNREAFRAVANTHRLAGDATIHVGAASSRRTLHVLAGNLIASQSNLAEDRLGELLAAQGKLDPSLIEPLSSAAKSQGKLLGALLLEEKLINPSDLAQALEAQVVTRFDRALQADGPVAVEAKVPAPQLTRRSLGALVLELFRTKVPLAELTEMLGEVGATPVRLASGLEPLGALGLLPAELRLARQLQAPKALDALLAGWPAREQAMRVLGALLSLELLAPG